MEDTTTTSTSALPTATFFQKIRLFIDKHGARKTVGIAIALLIAVNIPVAMYFSQQRQNVKQHASTNGSITIIDATTNLPITETTTPDIKLQILLPDNWELQQSTPSSRLNIIPKAYAQTTSPSATPEPTITPVTSPAPTSSPSATQIPPTSTIEPSPTNPPDSSPTASPSASTAPQKHFLNTITINNTELGGDNNEIRTITGPELITTLANPIPWKLNSLLPNENSAQRKVVIQFIDTTGTIVSTFSEITLLQNPNLQTSPTATPSATIDILDYFLTKHPDKGLTGTHPISQVVDGQRAYYMKWQKDGDPTGKSSIFEVYTWDNDNIYLKEDHSGAPVNFYTFAPGTWMKRNMAVGEKITVNSNTIQWYDPSCNVVPPQNQTFPIEMTLENHDQAFQLGEDLGNQDVIILKYDSSVGNPNGIFERFYYSREWGWVKWEQYNKTGGAATNTSIFNKIAQNPLQPLASAACTPEFRTPNTSPTPTPNSLGATLYFSPTSSSASAMLKKVGDEVLLDIFLDPNGESIAVSTLFLKYDPTTLEAKTFTMAPGGFTSILAPTTIGGGNAFINMTIGTDVTKIIKTNGTKIATITFKTLKETTIPTKVSFDLSESNVTSVTNRAVSVLFTNPNPAFITISNNASIIPTMTLIPTPTIPAGNTGFTIKAGLQGIGKGGNETPINQQRTFVVTLFDNTGIAVSTKSGMLTFNTETNIFEGQIDMGTPAPGNYTVKAKTDKYLTKVISNILSISQATKMYTFPTIPTLVAGDLNNDNLLNIEDFNIYKGCLGQDTAECISKMDLNNDGETDTVLPAPKFLDYRLLISNFSLQKGD